MEEHLIEGESPPGLFRLFEGFGEMYGEKSVPDAHKGMPLKNIAVNSVLYFSKVRIKGDFYRPPEPA